MIPPKLKDEIVFYLTPLQITVTGVVIRTLYVTDKLHVIDVRTTGFRDSTVLFAPEHNLWIFYEYAVPIGQQMSRERLWVDMSRHIYFREPGLYEQVADNSEIGSVCNLHSPDTINYMPLFQSLLN